MAEYCENCGEELDPEDEDEDEGLCKNYKIAQQAEKEYEKVDDYIDPGIT
jgi:hypothetical protein